MQTSKSISRFGYIIISFFYGLPLIILSAQMYKLNELGKPIGMAYYVGIGLSLITLICTYAGFRARMAVSIMWALIAAGCIVLLVYELSWGDGALFMKAFTLAVLSSMTLSFLKLVDWEYMYGQDVS